MKIAAVVYEVGSSHAVDAMLATVANWLAGQGVRVAGAIQINEERHESKCARMLLKDLTSGRSFDISICKQPGEVDCTLNPPALEDVAGLVAANVHHGADVVIINRFGKQEVTGDGFRSVIEAAVAEDIPVIIAVNATHRDSWETFTGHEAATVAPAIASVVAWCRASIAAGLDGAPPILQPDAADAR